MNTPTPDTATNHFRFLNTNLELSTLLDMIYPDNEFKACVAENSVFGVQSQSESGTAFLTPYHLDGEKGMLDLLNATLSYHPTVQPEGSTITLQDTLTNVIAIARDCFTGFTDALGVSDNLGALKFMTGLQRATDKVSSETRDNASILVANTVDSDVSNFVMVLLVSWGWFKDDEGNILMPYITFNIMVAGGTYGQDAVDFLSNMMQRK